MNTACSVSLTLWITQSINMPDWDTYYKIHAVRKPREQTVRAAALCLEKDEALDLGAGTLAETFFLLKDGFKKVTAIDSAEQIINFAEGLDKERLTVKVCTYGDFDFPENKYDLVNAQYALPFNGPEGFEELIAKIKHSLKSGGIFVGQLFGINDDWNREGTRLAFQTKDEALDLMKDLELVEFQEEEKEGNTASGDTKYWHVFHFIARK